MIQLEHIAIGNILQKARIHKGVEYIYKWGYNDLKVGHCFLLFFPESQRFAVLGDLMFPLNERMKISEWVSSLDSAELLYEKVSLDLFGSYSKGALKELNASINHRLITVQEMSLHPSEFTADKAVLDYDNKEEEPLYTRTVKCTPHCFDTYLNAIEIALLGGFPKVTKAVVTTPLTDDAETTVSLTLTLEEWIGVSEVPTKVEMKDTWSYL